MVDCSPLYSVFIYSDQWYSIFTLNSFTSRFVKEHIETMKPRFTLDPILIYAVLCFCPMKDVTLLFDHVHVPVHLALGRIAYQLNKCSDRSFQMFEKLEVII